MNVEFKEEEQGLPVDARKVLKGARQGLGQTGERLAVEELTRRGYRILERNVRYRYGEIDIVAQEGQDLVFIEVKTRRGDAYGQALEAISARKQQKLIQLATHYLDLHTCADCSWRIDVVAIQLSASGKLEEINVIPHAITE